MTRKMTRRRSPRPGTGAGLPPGAATCRGGRPATPTGCWWPRCWPSRPRRRGRPRPGPGSWSGSRTSACPGRRRPGRVLRAWQGLGYNRRALALRRTAQAVVERAAGRPRSRSWPPPRRRPVHGEGGGLLRPRPAGRPGRHQRRPGPGPPGRGRPAQLTPAARQRLADQALHLAAVGVVVGADGRALHCRPRPRCGGRPLEATCRWRALGPAAPPARPRAQAPFATSDRRWRAARALAAAPGGHGPGRPGRGRPGGRRRTARRLVRRPPGPPRTRAWSPRPRRPVAPARVSCRGGKERRWLRARPAWDQVGEDFKALGRQVKQHYDQRPAPRAPRACPVRGPAQGRRGPREAQGVAGAGVQRLGDAVRDPQVGEQTKKAAGSLSDALTATFAEASERFRKK